MAEEKTKRRNFKKPFGILENLIRKCVSLCGSHAVVKSEKKSDEQLDMEVLYGNEERKNELNSMDEKSSLEFT